MKIAVDTANEPAPAALAQQRYDAPVVGAAFCGERLDVRGRKNVPLLGKRLDALAMNLELAIIESENLKIASKHDGENIRALARIAEINERGLTSLDGGQ